jgi:hypothetical protein
MDMDIPGAFENPAPIVGFVSYRKKRLGFLGSALSAKLNDSPHLLDIGEHDCYLLPSP